MFSLRNFLTAAVLLCSLTTGVCGEQYKRVCYYTNWSQYRPGEGKFVPANIQPNLCTHVIYAFAKLNNNRMHTLEWNDDKMMKEVNALKTHYKDLKTLIAVGGWNARSEQFTTMVESYSTRLTFIKSAISFMKQYGFDGLDLDWEYPAKRGGRPQDKQNFGLLVKELHEAFVQEGQGRARFLLTAAVPAGQSNIDPGYDIPQIARYLDFINLMAYDLHGSWESVTGENSPLYPRSSESGAARQLNMQWAANYWVGKGTPKRKLIIGMATYGRSFQLVNSDNCGIGAAASGAGTAGKYTREAGFLAYYEICMRQQTSGQEHWDSEQHVPYYTDGKLWVGYDNERSIREKATWVKNAGFGGAMVWALDTDDFAEVCQSSRRPYPLLSTIHDVLSSGSFSTTTPPPTKRTTQTTKSSTLKTTTHPGTRFSCKGRPDGFYPDPKTKRGFYRCVSGQTYHFWCPAGTVYDPQKHVCVWPEDGLATTDQAKDAGEKRVDIVTYKTFCSGLFDGFYKDPSSCRGFYRCLSSDTYHFECPGRTLFNTDLRVCDWPENVTCD